MDFADWLKINRERKDLSYRKLAEAIKGLCSDVYLYKLEKRKYKGKKGKLTRPDDAIVIALAEVFGEDSDFALKLAAQISTESNIPLPVLEEGFEGINEAGILAIVTLMKMLKGQSKPPDFIDKGKPRQPLIEFEAIGKEGDLQPESKEKIRDFLAKKKVEEEENDE